jgi:hypothetical protein
MNFCDGLYVLFFEKTPPKKVHGEALVAVGGDPSYS